MIAKFTVKNSGKYVQNTRDAPLNLFLHSFKLLTVFGIHDPTISSIHD